MRQIKKSSKHFYQSVINWRESDKRAVIFITHKTKYAAHTKNINCDYDMNVSKMIFHKLNKETIQRKEANVS